ncbi:MAG: FAD binding domain-containing protein, partial [Myxococcota bacterium]
MKPAPFEYRRPDTVDEAVALLAEHGDEAKILAGGQSLIPTMNFRLAQPALLIDIGRLTDLDYIRRGEDRDGPAGGVRIGALTRQRTAERSSLIAERVPLIAEAMPHVAHVQIRNRGTVGGSVAHADPAAELPVLLVALGGEIRARSSRGERTIAAGDFFTGLLDTALEPDELHIDLAVPALPE